MLFYKIVEGLSYGTLALDKLCKVGNNKLWQSYLLKINCKNGLTCFQHTTDFLSPAPAAPAAGTQKPSFSYRSSSQVHGVSKANEEFHGSKLAP